MSNITNPKHYQHPSGIEVIDITRHETFVRGNIVKYVLRAPYKGSELQDLLKAQQYLAWEIERVETAEAIAKKDDMRVRVQEWVAAVDSGEAGYFGGDALAARINFAPPADELPTLKYVVSKPDDGEFKVGDKVTITPLPPMKSSVEDVQEFAPVIDLASRRTRIHSSPCTCKTHGTVA